MNKEQVLASFKAIGECESMEDVRTKLVELQENVEKDYDEHESVVADRDKKSAEIEKLQKNNMELFLKVTSRETDLKGSDEPKEKRNFKNLFNEKGGLK